MSEAMIGEPRITDRMWTCDCRSDPTHIPSLCRTGRVYLAPAPHELAASKGKLTTPRGTSELPPPGGGISEDPPPRIFEHVRIGDPRVSAAAAKVYRQAESLGWTCRLTYAHGPQPFDGRWVSSLAVRVAANGRAGFAIWESGKRVLSMFSSPSGPVKLTASQFAAELEKILP